jgi:hypothetical protein
MGVRPAPVRRPFLRCRRFAERFGQRQCLDLRARRIQDRCPARAGAPDHAPRSDVIAEMRKKELS